MSQYIMDAMDDLQEFSGLLTSAHSVECTNSCPAADSLVLRKAPSMGWNDMSCLFDNDEQFQDLLACITSTSSSFGCASTCET